MNANTTTHLPSDNFKILARRYNLTPGALRAIAADLGLAYDYSKDRRTWFLAEHPRTVRIFNDHLAENIA